MSPLGGNSPLFTTEVGFFVSKELASETSCFRACLRSVLLSVLLRLLTISFTLISNTGSSKIVRGSVSDLSSFLLLPFSSLGFPAFACFGTIMNGLYMLGRIIPNANIPIRIKPLSLVTRFLMNHHLLFVSMSILSIK
jgi:hypothetical protein